MKKNSVNRRSFIKSSSAGLAATSMANVFVERALAQTTGAKKVLIWWVPEGCTQAAFWPVNTGKLDINPNARIDGEELLVAGNSVRASVNATTSGYCLQPLIPHVNDISLYSGFRNFSNSTESDPHRKHMDTGLTGGVGKGSFDQEIAPFLKGSSPIESIYNCQMGHHVTNGGATNGYLSPARRRNGSTFGSANWNPMETYNQLFSNGVPGPETVAGPATYDRNLNTRLIALQSAEAQLKAVKCSGGAEAQHKLEILLESYEKLERDAQALIDVNNQDTSSMTADVRFSIPNGWTNTSGTRTDTSKYWNRSDNYEQLMDVSLDTVIAAFALDRTRVALCQFSGSGNTGGPAEKDFYRKVGIQGLEPGRTENHYIAHNRDGEDNATKRRNQARIFHWYNQKLANLITKMKETPDGNDSLFDNTLIITACEFAGQDHRTRDMPYMLCGGKNINFAKGVYRDAGDGNLSFRHQAEYFLGIANGPLGLNLPSFAGRTSAYNLM